jgi:hypothetical protein
MLGSGRTISKKERDLRPDLITQHTLGNMSKAKNKATAGFISRTTQYMKGSFLIMKSMGRVYISGEMAGSIMGVGRII